jgi:hypothetical protein
MSLERVFARIIFYFLEIAAKGFAAYLTYCGLFEFTDNGLGALYIAMAVFLILVALGWNMDKICEDAIAEYETEDAEYTIKEDL